MVRRDDWRPFDGEVDYDRLAATLAAYMADNFPTRREHDALDKRTTALEEWRLGQTRTEAERVMAIQQQINSTQVGATQQIAGQRAAIDERLLGWLLAALILVGSVVGPHLFK